MIGVEDLVLSPVLNLFEDLYLIAPKTNHHETKAFLFPRYF